VLPNEVAVRRGVLPSSSLIIDNALATELVRKDTAGRLYPNVELKVEGISERAATSLSVSENIRW